MLNPELSELNNSLRETFMKNISIILFLAVVGIATQLCSCRTSQTATTDQTTGSSDGSLGLILPKPTVSNVVMCSCACIENNGALFTNNTCGLAGFNFYAKTASTKQACMAKMNGRACSGYSQIKSVLANPKGVVAPPECKGPIAGNLANCAMKEVAVWSDQPGFPDVPPTI